MNWDDLRFVAVVAREGSLLRAAHQLEVEHTTVGRRIEAAEAALGIRLFARSSSGLRLTEDGERLLAPLQNVEDAVSALERRASAAHLELHGSVRVTAPETFGMTWLAPRLALFARQHAGLQVHLDPSGDVRDLSRRQAEVAVRYFRSKQKALVVRRVGEVGHGLYASKAYLSRYPLQHVRELKSRPLLSVPAGSVEAAWLSQLSEGTSPIFTSTLTVSLVAAAKSGAGIAVLPRYLGDAEPELQHLPMPNEPYDAVWLTVHQDLRTTPRVRAVLDFLSAQFTQEKQALKGK